MDASTMCSSGSRHWVDIKSLLDTVLQKRGPNNRHNSQKHVLHCLCCNLSSHALCVMGGTNLPMFLEMPYPTMVNISNWLKRKIPHIFIIVKWMLMSIWMLTFYVAWILYTFGCKIYFQVGFISFHFKSNLDKHMKWYYRRFQLVVKYRTGIHDLQAPRPYLNP